MILYLWNLADFERHQFSRRKRYKPIEPAPFMIIFHVHESLYATTDSWDKVAPERLQSIQLEKMLKQNIHSDQSS